MTILMERPIETEIKPRPGTYTFLDLSIEDIEAYLKRLEFPADKRAIISQARLSGATKDVLTFLNILPEGNYNNFDEVAFTAWEFLVV